jgi:hypothetical protein
MIGFELFEDTMMVLDFEKNLLWSKKPKAVGSRKKAVRREPPDGTPCVPSSATYPLASLKAVSDALLSIHVDHALFAVGFEEARLGCRRGLWDGRLFKREYGSLFVLRYLRYRPDAQQAIRTSGAASGRSRETYQIVDVPAENAPRKLHPSVLIS